MAISTPAAAACDRCTVLIAHGVSPHFPRVTTPCPPRFSSGSAAWRAGVSLAPCGVSGLSRRTWCAGAGTVACIVTRMYDFVELELFGCFTGPLWAAIGRRCGEVYPHGAGLYVLANATNKHREQCFCAAVNQPRLRISVHWIVCKVLMPRVIIRLARSAQRHSPPPSRQRDQHSKTKGTGDFPPAVRAAPEGIPHQPKRSLG